MNTFGTLLRLTSFGESHGPAIGGVLDGVPAGLPLDEAFIQHELDRRRPGQSSIVTARSEADHVELLSGVFEGVATGCPIGFIIRNTDQHSNDYRELAGVFRPGHADLGFFAKYGVRDYRGGGRSSARETAVRVAAGAIAKLLLKQVGVEIRACAFEIGGVAASRIDWDEVEKNPVRSPDAAAAAAMREAIEHARSGRDSVGGIVLCEAVGVPAGWGDPIFGKIDARLAGAMMSLGAARGFEVGDGFAVAKSHGSENNDAMVPGGGFATNHAGGILGGMSNGNTIVFRVAFKPTPSIAAPQKTVDVDGEAVELEIKGRHDPCVVPRAVPVVEAMTALVLADLMLTNRSSRV